MAIATLTYIVKDKEGNEKTINLESGPLKEIDEITRKCRNTYDVISSSKYKNRIESLVKIKSISNKTITFEE